MNFVFFYVNFFVVCSDVVKFNFESLGYNFFVDVGLCGNVCFYLFYII